ncbi:MAG TPA: ABC transporter ATP-binding protein [Geobacteraceae bacterium]
MTTPASAQSPLLDVAGVTLRYKSVDRLVTATQDVSFRVFPGDRLVLLGPSGCGKSTLLKAVGGFIKPAEGSISLRGKEVTAPGSDRIMVFQEFDQLLPWKTVRQNVVFSLMVTRRLAASEADEQAMHYLHKVKLTAFADVYPHTLSGGMKQRAAIARCLAVKPDIVLMDEPFAALDAITRQQMQEELLDLWRDTGFTMLFVTHSISEAVLLGNRIVMLSSHPGRVRAEIPVTLTESAQSEGELREIKEYIRDLLYADTIEYSI